MSFSPVPEYGQETVPAGLRESRLFLATFLGGSSAVLIPVIEYLSVGLVM